MRGAKKQKARGRCLRRAGSNRGMSPRMGVKVTIVEGLLGSGAPLTD